MSTRELDATDQDLLLELAYTPYDALKCHAPWTEDSWCKRRQGHSGDHAHLTKHSVLRWPRGLETLGLDLPE